MDKVAIVGMSLRVPAARTLSSFWENLCRGVEAIREFSDDELHGCGVSRETMSHPNYVKSGFVIDDVDKFDASFFYLSARDAAKMDPQVRMLLEAAWEALEDAGYDSEQYPGAIGVFAGALSSTYLLSNLYANPNEHAASIENYMRDAVGRMGNDGHFLASRVAYHLNLKGPAVSVQTACSTSLAAVHLATQSLLTGECDMALAGGAALRFPQNCGYFYERDGILSPDGRIRPFDSGAQGTVFGNGLGIVVLKRLEDALADGDHISAVLLGSALGNEGSGKVGYVAPSVDGQAEVIASAVAVSEVDPADVTYIEAHGTGTALGDPIELSALNQVYGRRRENERCHIGSVKANVGHLSIAAGVVGLIKTALMLKSRKIPPTLNFTDWHPECDGQQGRFVVPQELVPWEGDVLRAGVSSFGMGGTNVHLLVEQPPEPKQSTSSRPVHIIPFSAKTHSALQTTKRQALEHLRGNPTQELADVCFTYATGRRSFEHRSFVVAADHQQAGQALDVQDPARVFDGRKAAHEVPVVFMFPGQGAQYPEMGRQCYLHEAVYREAVDECSTILQPLLDLDLRQVLYPREHGVDSPPHHLKRTDLAQPALFTVEYALARLWESWGVIPAAMIGHSVGEFVAACLAGVFSLAEALQAVAMRGQMIYELPTGSMAAVPLSRERLAGLLHDEVVIAAVNESEQCTISGPKDKVQQTIDRLRDEGVYCRAVPTSHAFHSPMMKPAREKLMHVLRDMNMRPVQRPLVSTVTGAWITDREASDPGYWADQLMRPVEFARGLETLLTDGDWVLLEVGPGHTLTAFARRHSQRDGQLVLSSLGRAGAGEGEYARLMMAAGRLWLDGVEVNWRRFYEREPRRRLALPTYPFDQVSYWIEPQALQPAAMPAAPKKLPIDDWLYTPVWKQSLDLPQQLSLIEDESRDCWLVFTHGGDGLGDWLVTRLRATGREVVRVVPGDAFAQVDSDRYQLRPDEPEDYVELLMESGVDEKTRLRIVHLWLVDRTAGENELTVESFDNAQRRGLYSLLALTKALHRRGMAGPVHLNVLTSDLEQVTGQEHVRPEKATVRAGSRVIAQEHGNIRCCHIDISPSTDQAQTERWFDRLLRELLCERPESTIALRGAFTWVQDFARVEEDFIDPSPSLLREGGTYLITGGLGEIGSQVALMLHANYRARLVLLVRNPLPPRDRWDEILVERHAEDPLAVAVSRAARLEDAGARPLILSAELADFEQLSAAVNRAVEHFGELNGVIHAAGLPGEKWDHTVLETEVSDVRSQFAAKAYGQIHLERILADRPVDFCLGFSSLASVLGGLRLLAYAAANHFLSVAAARANARSAKTNWRSVAWDVWRHHQEEKRAVSEMGKTMDDKNILPEEGLEVLERIMRLPSLSQAFVSTWDFNTRLGQWVRRSRSAAAEEQRSDKSEHPRPEISQQFVPAESKLEKSIAGLLAEAVGVERIGMHDDLFELGGDSLLIVRLLSDVRERHAVDVDLASFLVDPTAAGLVALIQNARETREAADIPAGLYEEHDDDELLELLAEIEQLSHAEAIRQYDELTAVGAS